MLDLGAVDDAVRYARRAAEIWTNTLGPRHPKVAWAQDRLGWALLERGDREDAVTAFESALELFDPDVDDPRTRAKMERGLARALLPVDVAGATARARSALQTYRSLPYAEDEAQEVVSWMEANGLGGGAE